jgi:integrase
LTLAAWLESWLRSRARLREATLRSYSELCRNHLIPYLGRVPLRELTNHDIQTMLEAIRRHSAASSRPVSDSTIVRIYATLRAALNAALRAGLLEYNPARLVELPRIRRPHAVVWTEDRVAQWLLDGQRPPVAVWTATQTAQFLHAIRGHRLYAAYHLIALRGLRRGEAAGLRWCDLDLERRTMFICWQVQRIGGQIVQSPTKTPSSRRTVALDRTTVTALLRHRAAQQAEAAASGAQPSGYVFTNIRGGPFNPDYLTRLFADLIRTTGLPPVRLHDLRHGAASLALQAGADLKVVQDQLGHSSIVLTADTYVSVLPEVAHQAAENTAAIILQAGRLIPGTNRPRRPDPAFRGRSRPGSAVGSRAWRKARGKTQT